MTMFYTKAFVTLQHLLPQATSWYWNLKGLILQNTKMLPC